MTPTVWRGPVGAFGVTRTTATTRAERKGVVLNPAAVRATDFMRPRPGPIDPRSCPACALVKSIAIEAAETSDRELAVQWVELASMHARLGHPRDPRVAPSDPAVKPL
ncbi:hypothetical protein ABZX93_13845 [Streptomyces sp. NPDC006632]|uniref:hypothetical protein n=1 Tax=Streptomyces sp. NPDC006632 TaxID=3157182 RepID=UPI0033B483DB